MVKRVNSRDVAAMVTVLAAAVETGKKVVDAVDPERRGVAAVADAGRKVASGVRVQGPLERIEAQLAQVEQAAAHLAAQGGDDDVEVAAAWSQTAQVLRGKTPVVRVLDRKERKVATEDLQARAAALLDEVMRHGLGDRPEPPAKPRRRLPGRR